MKERLKDGASAWTLCWYVYVIHLHYQQSTYHL
jgi:hypothetical protein